MRQKNKCFCWLLSLLLGTAVSSAQEEPQYVQKAVVSDANFEFINRSGASEGDGEDSGPPPGRGPGGGGDADDGPGGGSASPVASMEATFSNFELNGIAYAAWQNCRAGTTAMSIDECLQQLIADSNNDGVKSLTELHPGAIGGDTLTFDVTITNTSGPGVVLTAFAFQSKFSESPALGSRIGDKLFSAARVAIDSTAPDPLIGVKKNGTSNGLFGGKIKGICINSSNDYPPELNLGVENETLECTGGRTFVIPDVGSVNPITSEDAPQLQAADGTLIDPGNIKLPKGLLPGESMTMRLLLDAGTDDGALERQPSPDCAADDPTCLASVGPLVGSLANAGIQKAPTAAAECLELDVQNGTDNVLNVVNFGDVKIIRDSDGNCVPSFYPFSKNQFLTVPRRNWGFTDILDTRDDYLPGELPTVLTGHSGKFSMLDHGNLRPGELNFFEILRGFGESGETLDPSCELGGSREGSCGGSPYVPWAEFYTVDGGNLIRREVAGSYYPADYDGEPTIGAGITTDECSPGGGVCKITNVFETPGNVSSGASIGASAEATFSDVVVISDDKATVANEGGQAGGDRVQFTVTIKNTSCPNGESSCSDIYLTSFNFQTKRRGLTDINGLDGTSILGRQDLRTGAGGGLASCGSDPHEAECFDVGLGIGRFPNVIGNSLLSSTFVPDFPGVDGPVVGQLEAIKKNGTFEPLMKSDTGTANFVCIKSGAPSEDQDADETCSGTPGAGLLPGESQSVRIEMDYGDFRGLILKVSPGTLADFVADPDFGLLDQRGDFDCQDQRRLPYCHPSLNGGDDWFTSPTSLTEVEFVTVHQPGEAATVMNFEDNFGFILAMAGFIPTAEFYQGNTQLQVRGEYLLLSGGGSDPGPEPEPDPEPEPEPENQLPNVNIAEPDCTGLTCVFDGSGSSDPDGSIADYDWVFLSGDDETGGAAGAIVEFTFPAAGIYTARLTVTDNAGGSADGETDVTVDEPEEPEGDATLTLATSKDRGLQQVQLNWTGLLGASVDIHRSGSSSGTIVVSNDEEYLDKLNRRGGGTYTYSVCESGSNVCTNSAQAAF